MGSRLLFFVALVAVGATGWLVGAPAGPVDTPVRVVEVDAKPSVLIVHVGGAVAKPGLVAVEDGARVADAIRVAGGLLPAAAIDGVNLARPLADGEQVLIPVEGAGSVPAEGSDRIRVNTATASELEALPGVGPVLAGRIVAHRDASGPFTGVEDLLAVPGIGERMLASLRDLVEVP
ncbi:MAG: ComEA family DNA-binding protein [Acidimicrobiia bacterium]|nr:ComEA family DNA-binding protein [Acidimicrobiia bacterium]